MFAPYPAKSFVGAQWDNFNLFGLACKNALALAAVKLKSKEKKQFEAAVSWTNPDADRVIAENHKIGTPANPQYGLFACDAAEVARNTLKTGKALVKLGDVVEFEADSALRENENVPPDPSCSVTGGKEAYFQREVAPHVPDAWIDDNKRDKKDGALGIVVISTSTRHRGSWLTSTPTCKRWRPRLLHC